MIYVWKDCYVGCVLADGVDEWYWCHDNLGYDMEPMCSQVGECMCT